MLSNRPYLLRAFYQWIIDSHCTPILVIDTTRSHCKVPKELIEDGEVVFNVSPNAVRDFKIKSDIVEFKASFSGVVHIISAPLKAILAVYAEENNEGLFFDTNEQDDDGSANLLFEDEDNLTVLNQSSDTVGKTSAEIDKLDDASKKKKPFLKLVE